MIMKRVFLFFYKTGSIVTALMGWVNQPPPTTEIKEKRKQIYNFGEQFSSSISFVSLVKLTH